MSRLFDPVKIGPVTLANRLVMAPLTRRRNFQDRCPGELQITHYTQRATAGLILTEATNVSPKAVGYYNTPGLWTEEQVQAWKRVVDAVHAKGGKICVQLWHVGRISDPEVLDGDLPVAPSAIAMSGDVKVLRPRRPYVVPRPLETEEVAGIVQDFAKAAANARRAGFDLVEIHGANGYLFDQFMHDGVNKRTDRYGGPIENRVRFLLETVDAIARHWERDRIGVHLNLMSSSHDMSDSNPQALFTHVAEQLEARKIGFIFGREALVTGTDGQPVLPIGQHVRRIFKGAYIANEALTKESAEMILDKGWADAVSFGRPYMANPDLVERFKQNAPLNALHEDRHCDESGRDYNDYPTLQAVLQP